MAFRGTIKKFVSDFFATDWSTAIKVGDFALIADWFMAKFFVFGLAAILFAGIAAYYAVPASPPPATAATHLAAAATSIPGKRLQVTVAHANKNAPPTKSTEEPTHVSMQIDVASPAAFALRVFVVAGILAGAAAMVGWVLGLLFGIPRSLARPQPVTPANGNLPDANAVSRVNTNLEDVSDWLTKTLIGVGLTQLAAVPKFFCDIAEYANKFGFGWPFVGQSLAIGIVLYFFLGAFWLGYVGTRTILTKLFDQIAAGFSPQELQDAADPDNVKIANGAVSPADQPQLPIDAKLLHADPSQLKSTLDVAAYAGAKARNGQLNEAKQILSARQIIDPTNSTVKDLLGKLNQA